jgi:hypothetical protein
MPVAKEKIPTVRLITRVSGKIWRAKGLLNSKLMGKSVPRCLVKGIKGNSHLVDFFSTDVGKGQDPQWDASWSYDCLQNRSHEEFVGLKFICYDGEDFMGGADVDISELPVDRDIEEELELTGMVFSGAKGQAPKKARLFIAVSVSKWPVPVLPRPRLMLLNSVKSVTRTTAICGRIVRGRGMRPRSAAMCFVRCYMLSGRIIDMHVTRACPLDMVDPQWNETFAFDFDDEYDQPLMLMFNTFGSSESSSSNAAAIFNADDHLGSTMLPVDRIGTEQQFQNGEARAKLRLLDECQQIEKRMEKDAGRAAREAKKAADALNAKKQTLSQRLQQASKQLSEYRRMRQGASDKWYLTVELFAERKETFMPHYELMNESQVVEEADLQLDPDTELQKYFDGGVREDGETVKRLEIGAEERIFTVYGRVNSAMDLIAADATGKSDPYVIVEALTKTGESMFVYRTRYIKANLNPVWHEGFFWKVPPDPDNPTIPVALSKIQFSVYDTDEGQLLESGDDDFLGHCGVDVSFMRNQDYVNEDIPLLGVKIRSGSKTKGGFRRYSTLSAEVRVERRVVRIVSAKHDFDAKLLECPRHIESRGMLPPEVPTYRDQSQEVALYNPGEFDSTASTVLDLRDSNSLLAFAKSRHVKQVGDEGWLATKHIEPKNLHLEPPLHLVNHPSLRAVETPDKHLLQEKEKEKVLYRRDWPVLKKDWKQKMGDATMEPRNLDYVNRLPPMKRTGSVPIMATRFGDRYRELSNTMNPFEEDFYSSSRCLAQEFTEQSAMLDTVMEGIRTKPNFGHYTMRRENARARTAPR